MSDMNPADVAPEPDKRLRHGAKSLFAMLAVVAVLAGLVIVAGVRAQQSALSVHRKDRAHEQVMLASLTDQYLNFSLAGLASTAQLHNWVLRPDDPQDQKILRGFLASNQLLSYAAALTTINGAPLAVVGGAVPGPSAGGYTAMRDDLVAGQPGLSGVLPSPAGPLLAMAVPVSVGGQVSGLLIGYAALRSWPLEGYVRRLDLGPSAKYRVLDSAYQIVASSDPASIGSSVRLPAALRPGASGLVSAAGQVVSAAPVDLDGWLATTSQPTAAFQAGLTGPFLWLLLAFAVLLAAGATGLTVSERRRRQALGRLAAEAVFDPLTGAATRRLLEARLTEVTARMKRTGNGLVVGFVDIDAFKKINDRLGHGAGDQVLIATAARLRACVRPDDLVARVGGDEFVVLAEGVPTEAHVEAMAQRIRTACREPVVSGNRTVEVTLSIGLAVVSRTDPDVSLALNAADLAMYAAKRAGGDSHVISRPESPERDLTVQLTD